MSRFQYPFGSNFSGWILFISMLSVPTQCWCQDMLVVVGAPGTEEYRETFQSAADKWQQLARANEISCVVIGNGNSGTNDRELMEIAWTALARSEKNTEGSQQPIWLILIGHGTYADSVAKFNLRGPDFSAKELLQWITPIRRPLVIVNGASSSGPFVNRLSGPNRIVVSATRSGSEQNYARFGSYFADAISSVESDLDHDEEVSVSEAFLSASQNVESFYSREGRLSTEHSLLDDNGDGAGTPFKMLLALFKKQEVSAKSGKPLDGKFASKISLSPTGQGVQLTEEQKARRAELEQQLDTLQREKSRLNETEFLARAEPILVNLSRIYRQVDESVGEPGGREKEVENEEESKAERDTSAKPGTPSETPR